MSTATYYQFENLVVEELQDIYQGDCQSAVILFEDYIRMGFEDRSTPRSIAQMIEDLLTINA